MAFSDGKKTMLTVKEAAAHLRVNAKTIYGDIQSGRLRAIRVGRVIRIPLSAIDPTVLGH